MGVSCGSGAAAVGDGGHVVAAAPPRVEDAVVRPELGDLGLKLGLGSG